MKLLRQAEARGARKLRGERPRRRNGVTHSAEIAGTAAVQRQPRQRPGQIRCAFQLFAQRLAQTRLAGEITDGVEARIDGAASVSGLPRRLASSRAPAPVTVRSIAASRLAARAPWFPRISSRLARVAASISSRLPGASFRGGRIRGARPTWVIST